MARIIDQDQHLPRSELVDTFEDLLDRCEDLDSDADNDHCRLQIADNYAESPADADDPFFHRAADAGFFGLLA